ncbi:hypothetical protein EES39_38785 [Streptomyces sp. ADI92-24]|uniref:hypothetical protein n=1 Tax=Streptomyces sp. ADI92-24 TaxID=1522756 RepID=UPI000F54E284|nr:hypothetical protein [Streptomyces sp. ADI92-24]RPK32437.1 hypothetical protein EES39_38785 [Streptomyces sp. ADI92-24]
MTTTHALPLYASVRAALEVSIQHTSAADSKSLSDAAWPHRLRARKLGRGPWGAQQLGAVITCLPADGPGKTVRATMRPGPVQP